MGLPVNLLKSIFGFFNDVANISVLFEKMANLLKEQTERLKEGTTKFLQLIVDEKEKVIRLPFFF